MKVPTSSPQPFFERPFFERPFFERPFFERLEARARAIDSLLCVGLDPHPADLPSPTADAALAYCLRIVAATRPWAVAYKPNSAFFERYGAPGVEALAALIRAIGDEIPVLLDAKRGDIGSTAKAYATAAFEAMGAGALTVNSYLGGDALAPFTDDPRRGVFVLCKTSNPGSADLQELRLADGRRVFEAVAQAANQWNAGNNVGLVVGATHPEALSAVRIQAPELWILAPGVGAQGGDLEASLAAGLRADGLGVLLPVSRSIARAKDSGAAAEAFVKRIRAARAARAARAPRSAAESSPLSRAHARLADGLLEAGCVRFGRFTLKSGATSPIYLDLRRLIASPQLMAQVARAYVALMGHMTFDHVAALPYAALPIGTAVALQGGWSMVYPRREAKSYGTKATVEGVYQPGDRVVVLDDLATTGLSKIEAIEKLQAVGLEAVDVVVLIDREGSAKEALEGAGYRYHSVLRLSELLDYWEMAARISSAQAADARAFLEASQ